jgi:hypothetical protein
VAVHKDPAYGWHPTVVAALGITTTSWEFPLDTALLGAADAPANWLEIGGSDRLPRLQPPQMNSRFESAFNGVTDDATAARIQLPAKRCLAVF